MTPAWPVRGCCAGTDQFSRSGECGGQVVTLCPCPQGLGELSRFFPGTAASDNLIPVKVVTCVKELAWSAGMGCPALVAPWEQEQQEVMP